jgi:hypothetical protein
MKTLTQTMIAFVVLSLLATAFTLAQTSQPVTPSPAPSPAPAPASPTPAAPVTPTPIVQTSKQNIQTSEQNLIRQLDSLVSFSNAYPFGNQAGGSNMILVIPSEQTKTEDLIAINEDMNIMSRIFEKNLEQKRITTVNSNIFLPGRHNAYGMLLGSSRGQIQSMYLQGYGALFMLKVDFPLSASSEAQQQQQDTEKQQEGDSVWKQTQQEIYEPQGFNTRRQPQKQQVKYDPEKVENLKTTLIKTLKHAANIRSLKPDESVILTVAGGGQSAGTKITAINVAGKNQILVTEKRADGKSNMRIINGNALDDIGLSSQTVLVIRAKRSDIDAFAKGELDLDQFRTHVQMFTYPYLGSVKVRGDSIGYYGDSLPRSSGTNIR